MGSSEDGRPKSGHGSQGDKYYSSRGDKHFSPDKKQFQRIETRMCEGGTGQQFQLVAASSRMCDGGTVEYLRDLVCHKEALQVDTNQQNELVSRLIEQEMRRVQGGGRPPGREQRLLDVYNERPVRLSARVSIPVREHPKFNFVGKLLGPRGSSLKQLQEDTMTKMAVLGRGSMRNKQQEEELRNSTDPKHSHLKEELHVEITAFASPAEAHARLAFALTEVRKYLIPDSNDQIRQQQMREIQVMKRMQLSEEGNRVSEECSTSSTDNDSGHETDSTGSPKSEGERGNTSILDRMLSSTNQQCRQRPSPMPSCHCHPYKRREETILSHPSKRLKEVQ